MEPVAFRERVRVHDQYGPVGVIGSGEYEEVGQVQAGIAAGGLEVGGAEVVRHGYSFGGTCLGGRAAQGISWAGFVAEISVEARHLVMRDPPAGAGLADDQAEGHREGRAGP